MFLGKGWIAWCLRSGMLGVNGRHWPKCGQLAGQVGFWNGMSFVVFRPAYPLLNLVDWVSFMLLHTSTILNSGVFVYKNSGFVTDVTWYHGKKYFGSGFSAIKDHNSLPWKGVGLSPLELADATARAVAWKPWKTITVVCCDISSSIRYGHTDNN